jgi:hypothetical protein
LRMQLILLDASDRATQTAAPRFLDLFEGHTSQLAGYSE